MPALSAGFLNQASEPRAFGAFDPRFGGGPASGGFHRPSRRASDRDHEKGGDILSQILASHKAREEIALRASSATGISQDTLAKNAPCRRFDDFRRSCGSMENQGFGGILGQLANAAGQGGLGPILGQILGGSPASANPQPAAKFQYRTLPEGKGDRLHSRPDSGRRPGCNWSWAAGTFRAWSARGTWRHFGIRS